MASPWAGLRYEFISNQIGVGVTGTSMVISRPCRLFDLRSTSLTANSSLALYDHTNRPQNPIVLMTPSPTAPDMWPRIPVHRELKNGLYVSFSMGTGTIGLEAGWETSEPGEHRAG